ncbi:MAG TPA: sugar phosphate isomerase/epimerase [Candidatus Hydrogenedentes bacterium]|nr:sugar phosphate isomerase/epimerase [Candidatus Hydrogenedentota bacterium]
MNIQLTRREALMAGAAAALPVLGATALTSSANPAEAQSPKVGVSTLGFNGHTNAELAKELAANGIRTVQLFLSQKDSNYWVYNGRNDVSALDAQRCKEIAGAYASEGITIHSIGVYTNLIHPDKGERKANMDYFEAMFRIGEAMNVHTFITEAGHFEPPDGGGVPHHFQEDVWTQMVDTGKELVKRAESYDAKVLFEPFYRGFLASAKRTRLFLEAVDSPRARALLDPANLIEINDLEEMFAQLAPFIDCLHAKDRKLHVDRGVAAGQGDLDYVQFVALAAKYAPHAPFILEYVGIADYKQALEVLYNAISKYESTGV